jgi:hypothetical protein
MQGLGAIVRHPRREPSAKVAAAGHRGQVVELAEQAVTRQRRDDPERERATPDAAARQAERGGRVRACAFVQGWEANVPQSIDGR